MANRAEQAMDRLITRVGEADPVEALWIA